jgi:4a-hydroxytetrahydrobiopterin dehydratase
VYCLLTIRFGVLEIETMQVLERSAITKSFEFTDFNQAWGFMLQSALIAEEFDHHPEWFNAFNRVEVTLTTYDCGGISEKVREKCRKFLMLLLEGLELLCF